MAGRTQAALYDELDLELSWSEAELPQAQRTKHVHALHPYLGKYVPQLVEVFLERFVEPGGRVLDPFSGSGTTLVEANVFGCAAVGCDISAFNCLLARVKTRPHDLEQLQRDLDRALERALETSPGTAGASDWLQLWYAPRALAELLAYREQVNALPSGSRDVAQIVLSRSARSARLTTHFDLDFPKEPTRGAYQCYKHKRICRPVGEAAKFLRRYSSDTLARLREYDTLRTDCDIDVIHGDTRRLRTSDRFHAVVTSPPYPGLIDYHEQHRYAYELLGFEDRRQEEIGAAAGGRTKASLARYADGMVAAFEASARHLEPSAPVVIVVNDTHDVYPAILERAGLDLVERRRRHVNRRTGRRSGEYYEHVLVCRAQSPRVVAASA